MLAYRLIGLSANARKGSPLKTPWALPGPSPGPPSLGPSRLSLGILRRQFETLLIYTLQAIWGGSISEQQSIGRQADIPLSAYRLVG